MQRTQRQRQKHLVHRSDPGQIRFQRGYPHGREFKQRLSDGIAVAGLGPQRSLADRNKGRKGRIHGMPVRRRQDEKSEYGNRRGR